MGNLTTPTVVARRLRIALAVGLASIAMSSVVAAQGTDSTDYVIGAEDVLQIRVWEHPDLETVTAVSLSGRIQLPLIGSVQATGMTPEQLGRVLSDRYSLIDQSMSDVIVMVVDFQSRSVTVVGEVRSPGRIGFREIPDLITVLLRAGGATPTADLERVQIVREEQTNEEPRTIVVDLSAGMDKIPPKSLPELRPRDTVVVPALSEGMVSGTAFQVLGAVRSPGMYRLNTADTVVEAMAASGGPLGNADLRQVRLTRRVGDRILTYRLNLQEHLYEGHPAPDLELRSHDTITVPEKHGLGIGTVFQGMLRVIPLATSVVSLVIALNN